MRRLSLICLLFMLPLTLAACAQQIHTQDSREATPEISQSDLQKYDEAALSESVASKESENIAGITGNTAQPASPGENRAVTRTQMVHGKKLVLSVNGKDLDVSWENNSTVDELVACAQRENIVVDTALYGGFEQTGSLPQDFSGNDVQITTEPGDIVLYSGNQIVLFFGSNSWSYTMLGHIEGLSNQELSELLGAESAAIEIKLN